ncbi:MAG: prephenate dehydratase domain-containing protein, partial [Candidatus Limnocylindria bacterium]
MMTVAYQGEPGAFGEEAVFGYFGAEGVTPMPMSTFSAVCAAVTNGSVDAGVLPLENSLAGTVGDALDALADGSLSVVGELLLPIRHQLLVLPGVGLQGLKRVSSHWQALAQCDRFLAARAWEVVPADDTAGAARELASSGDRTAAATASAR